MIMCKGDMRLGSGCGKCVGCVPKIKTELFEDWYMTYFQEFIELEDDLVKDNEGEYLDVRVALMHKAFLAGHCLDGQSFETEQEANQEVWALSQEFPENSYWVDVE